MLPLKITGLQQTSGDLKNNTCNEDTPQNLYGKSNYHECEDHLVHSDKSHEETWDFQKSGKTSRSTRHTTERVSCNRSPAIPVFTEASSSRTTTRLGVTRSFQELSG